MNSKLIVAIAIAVLIGIGSFYIISIISKGKVTGQTIYPTEPRGDVFEGVITNMKVSPGTLNGAGVYDKSCISIGNGLTKCDAGIKTDEYGILNFNYIHNMGIKPCIAPGDKLSIKVTNSDGSAIVQRY